MIVADYNGRSLVLCDERSEDFSTRITAVVEKGRFKVCGRDEGSSVEAFYGEPVYEYSYRFNAENSWRLFSLLGGGEKDPFDVLAESYTGMNAATQIRKYADGNGIEYVFKVDSFRKDA